MPSKKIFRERHREREMNLYVEIGRRNSNLILLLTGRHIKVNGGGLQGRPAAAHPRPARGATALPPPRLWQPKATARRRLLGDSAAPALGGDGRDAGVGWGRIWRARAWDWGGGRATGFGGGRRPTSASIYRARESRIATPHRPGPLGSLP